MSGRMVRVSHERLKSILGYDGKTGDFFWRVKVNQGVKKGDKAGNITTNGYWQIGVDGIKYTAHRLAWFYVHGYFPENDIDHINQNKIDNRIVNLREASRVCNMRNTGNKKSNQSGVKGVCWGTIEKKWRASIMVSGKQKGLGSYHSFDDAVCARLAGEQCLSWSGCDSNSPAFQYVQKNIITKKEVECQA